MVSQINSHICHKYPSVSVTAWSGTALTPERLKTEVLLVRFTRLTPAPSNAQKPKSRSRQL